MITGETGAGKSLIIDALGLALGARADTSLVRHGADAARVEALFDRVPGAAHRRPRGRGQRSLDGSSRRRGGHRGPPGRRGRSARRDPRPARPAAAARRALAARPARRVRRARGRSVRPWPRPSTAGARTGRRSRSSRSIRARWAGASRCSSTRRPRSLPRGCARERPRRSEARLAAAQHGEAIARGSADAPRRARRRGRRRARRRRGRRCARRGRWRASIPASSRSPSGSPGSRRSWTTSRARPRRSPRRVDHDPAELARLEERLRPDLRARTALRRRRGGGHRPWRARRGRGGAARAAWRASGRRRGGRGCARCSPRSQRPATALRRPRGRRPHALAAAGRAPSSSSSASRRASSTWRSGAARRAATSRPIELDGDAVAFDATGVDQVVYRLAPNPGEPPRPLARIASGGELSRVALAIKQVLAEADATPTLVFDEVDTGIGGRSADPVGRSALDARAPPPGPVRHAPAPDRRPRRRPFPDHEARARRADRHGRRAARSRGPDRRACPDARRLGGGQAALASARELLDRAEAWRARRRAPAALSDGGGRGLAPGRHRRLPRPPPRRARTRRRARSWPTAATWPTSRPSRSATRRLGTLARCRAGLPRCANAPRAAQRPGARADEPAAPRRRAPGLLPVRVRRGADRGRRRRAPRSARVSRGSCRRRSRSRRSSGCSMRPAATTPTSRSTRCGCATGRCSSCSTRPACGSARRLGLDARTCRSTAGSSGSSARATANGSSRWATSRSTGSPAGSADHGRRCCSWDTSRRLVVARCSSVRAAAGLRVSRHGPR